MATVNTTRTGIQSLPSNGWRFVILLAMLLHGCASTEDLFSHYDEHFCLAPVAATAIAPVQAVEKEVFRDRVVIREIPAAGSNSLPWEPAIYFESASAKLTPAARQSLDGNILLLMKFPKVGLSVRGFTDVRSSSTYNINLSKERTRAVKSYLLDNDIAEKRIVGYSFGETVPLANNNSPVADEINRRVEMVLLDEDGRPLSSRQSILMGPVE